jgi:hypothetical protein
MRDDVEPDPVQRMQRERARLLKQKQAELRKKTQSVSEVHSVKSGKDSQRLEGRGLLELPSPVAKGRPGSPPRVTGTDSRATHARTLLPAALASVPFGFVLVQVRVRVLPSVRSVAIDCSVLCLVSAISH